MANIPRKRHDDYSAKPGCRPTVPRKEPSLLLCIWWSTGVIKATTRNAGVAQQSDLQYREAAHLLLQQAIAERTTSLDTHEVQPILQRHGMNTLPTWIASDSTEAVHIAEQIGYPVSLRLRSPDIPHVRIQGVMSTCVTAISPSKRLTACSIYVKWPGRSTGRLLVQSMANRASLQELRVVWLRNDPVFGPLIVLGEGGVEWRPEDQAVVVSYRR